MLIDNLLKTIMALSLKAEKGMVSILRKNLFPPVNETGIVTKCGLKVVRESETEISVSTDFPQYGYWAKYGRGTGKMPPDEPIRDWVKRHNINEKFVFPIRRKMAEEGSKRFRENNPLNYTLPLERMIEMIKKTVGLEAVKITRDEIYKHVQTLNGFDVKL